MGLLSSTLKAVLQQSTTSIYIVLEIDFPGEETSRYAKAGVMSSTNGAYQSKVVSFGKLNQKIAPLQNSLSAITTDVVLTDIDFAISNRLGKGQRILNSPCRIYMASGDPSVPESDWFQLFGGILTGWEQRKIGEWILHLQTPDIKLNTVFPRYQINRFDFASIDKGAIGTHKSHRRVDNTVTLGSYTPLIYGKHDDYADQSAGAIPCLFVDSALFQYLVSIGWTRVLRVYVDGIIQTSGFSITHPTVNGRYYTIIDFTSTQSGKTITADVEGYETIGDGTGKMIADPLGVIQHMVTNFILNDYQSGLWIATDATFWDTTATDATQLALHNRANGAGYACARYLSNQLTGMQAINEFCASFNLVPYWTNAGKLAIKIDDPNVIYPNTYIDDPFLRWEEIQNPSLAYFGTKQASRVIATFENISSGGSGTSTSNTVPKEYYQIEVEDPLSVSLSDEHMSLTWGPSTYP